MLLDLHGISRNLHRHQARKSGSLRFATFSSGRYRLIQPQSLATEQLPKLSPFTSFSKLSHFDYPSQDLHFEIDASLQQELQGKLLLLQELPHSIELIHSHYLHGYIGYKKAIIQKNDEYGCQRCGNRVQRLFASFSCARCDDTCTYCRKCIMLGRASECTPLVYWRGSDRLFPPQNEDDSMHWEGVLSVEQERASRALIETVKERKERLVWAVCGSGKTEILYEALAYAFSKQLRVCIASPRVDVVLELQPRLRSAFPTIPQNVLYGDAPYEENNGQLVLATTHQLLRFRQAFDVLIVDEVDAFPYSLDEMLAFAVKRARKEAAATIYLTATPNAELKRAAKAGTLPAIKIPVRYHRHPLPVPQFTWIGNWQRMLKKGRLPHRVLAWCEERYVNERPFFLFVPSIEMGEQVYALLAQHFSDVAFVHAEDDDRKEKVTQFRQGHLRALVTTTILERGVTVPSIDVAVLGSEAELFTESALVQIAGRVGRSADDPTGDVRFFHYGLTEAMAAAKRHIEEMNNHLR